jgi:hypothetical protein
MLFTFPGKGNTKTLSRSKAHTKAPHEGHEGNEGHEEELLNQFLKELLSKTFQRTSSKSLLHDLHVNAC